MEAYKASYECFVEESLSRFGAMNFRAYPLSDKLLAEMGPDTAGNRTLITFSNGSAELRHWGSLLGGDLAAAFARAPLEACAQKKRAGP